jgi:orotate phosphoribosyltransferase
MTPTNLVCQAVDHRLVSLANGYLFSDFGQGKSCLTRADLLAAARFPRNHAPAREHLDHCSWCARTFTAFRGSYLATVLPDEWDLAMRIDEPQTFAFLDERPLLLRISLETRQAEFCRHQEDWVSSPLWIRVAMIVDVTADVVSLSMYDVPSVIRSVAFSTPLSSHSVVCDDESNEFEFIQALSDLCAVTDAAKAAKRIADWLQQGQVRLTFTANPTSPQRVRALLDQAGAIERDFDYELPSGFHTDTHINIAKLCRTESTLHRVATALDTLLRESSFDTIITNGWAMATIARRLLRRRQRGLHRGSGQVVIFEGYHRLSPVGDLVPGSRVLILTDVIVTGGLATRLKSLAEHAGAVVTDTVALVSSSTPTTEPTEAQTLCRVPMKIVASRDQDAELMQKESRVFNPVSGAMTQRAPSPRSPSEFLEYDDQARQFWEFIDRTGAYQHHHREGSTHYIAFVDTKRLLSHSEIARQLAAKLSSKVIAKIGQPDFLLVPDRSRSRSIAQHLLHAFRQLGEAHGNIRLIGAERSRRRRARGSPQEWQIPLQIQRQLNGAKVLIVDAAAGHGTTIDQLWQLIAPFEPSTVAAAVLLSRLTEGCEDAFNARLNGGFHSLFRLPIRPIVIRGGDRGLCPVCRRNTALREVGHDSGVEAIRLWAEHLTQRHGHAASKDLKPVEPEHQLALFKTGDEFLRGCRESVASGVTLHALNAAMTNGMAALSLPELRNDRIPSQNRAAMVRNLPRGAFEWSGDVLTQDLLSYLRNSTSPNVWRASVEALARHGSTAWLEHLAGFVERVSARKPPLSPGFWNHLACSAYLTAAANPDDKQMVRNKFQQLATTSRGTSFEDGIQLVLTTITKFHTRKPELQRGGERIGGHRLVKHTHQRRRPRHSAL